MTHHGLRACQALTRKGTRCTILVEPTRAPVNGLDLCHVHDPTALAAKNREASRRMRPQRVSGDARGDGPRCGCHARLQRP